MKILVLDPSWPGENAVSSNRIVTASTGGAPQQNEGAMCVTEAARMAGYNAEFFQAPYHGTPKDALAKIEKVDVLALSLMQWNTPNGLFFAKMAKEIKPVIKVAVGGVQPSCIPSYYANISDVDGVFAGEGEEMFVNWLNSGMPKGQFQAMRIIDWGRYEPKVDQAILNKLYFRGLGVGSPGIKAWGFNFSRGCKGKCKFCCTPCVFPGGEIADDVPNAVRRLTNLHKQGVEGVDINNATFNDEPELARTFCDTLIASGLQMPWTAMCGTHKKDYNLYAYMKKAGCRKVGFGFEAPTEKARKALNKRGFSDASVNEASQAAANAGLLIRGYLMIGDPTEDIEELKDALLQTLTMLPIDEPRIAFINPNEGTAYHKEVLSAGYPIDSDWTHYTTNRPVIGDEDLAHRLTDLRKEVIRWFWVEGPGHSKMRERIARDPIEWLPRYRTFFTRDLIPNGFLTKDEIRMD